MGANATTHGLDIRKWSEWGRNRFGDNTKYHKIDQKGLMQAMLHKYFFVYVRLLWLGLGRELYIGGIIMVVIWF